MLARLCLVSCLVAAALAQMQPQCECSSYKQCESHAADDVLGCVDRCQAHFGALGISYPAARQCILAHQGEIQAATRCMKGSFGQVCSATPGAMVPKRYGETLKLAFFREINSMLSRSGILSQATAMLRSGRRAVGCIQKCNEQRSCTKQGNCGLALPSDNVIVQNAKQCFLGAGFNTAVIQEICSCLSRAGAKGLASLCPRIVIS